MVDGDDSLQAKFECKEADPLRKQPSCKISPHNSGTITDSEESSVKANRKLTMVFPTSHQPRSYVAPNFSKMEFRCPNVTFFCINFEQKVLKVCYKVSLSKSFHRHSCSIINYLSNGINILVGDDPRFCKIWKDVRFSHVSHAARCAVGDSRTC